MKKSLRNLSASLLVTTVLASLSINAHAGFDFKFNLSGDCVAKEWDKYKGRKFYTGYWEYADYSYCDRAFRQRLLGSWQ